MNDSEVVIVYNNQLNNIDNCYNNDQDDDDEIPPTQYAITSIEDDNKSEEHIDIDKKQQLDDEDKQNQAKIWGELLAVSDKLSSVTLSDDSLVLGRLKTCNITIPENIVSAKHCRLFKSSNDSVLIQDLSTNGTYINGKIIGRGNLEAIKNGDRISLAGSSLDHQLTYIFKDNQLVQKNLNAWDTLATKEILNDYDIIGELGRGAFSVVYLGVNKSKATKVAIKDIDLSKYNHQRHLNQLNREIEILRSIKHPNIIDIHEIFQSNHHIFIVMELATGGELYEKLENDGSLSEEYAKHIFKQLLNAVDYLHSHGIAHRDLKPENILFDGENLIDPFKIKIVDFGLARVIGENELAKTLCGTPLYVAPEVIVSKTKASNNNKFSNGYGFTCDAWSLGAILYILLSGEPPFCDDTQYVSTPTIFDSIVSGDISYPDYIWSNLSNDALDLVKKLLTVDPSMRITIKDALKHPWISDINENNKIDYEDMNQSNEKKRSIENEDDISSKSADETDVNNCSNNNENILKKRKTFLY